MRGSRQHSFPLTHSFMRHTYQVKPKPEHIERARIALREYFEVASPTGSSNNGSIHHLAERLRWKNEGRKQ